MHRAALSSSIGTPAPSEGILGNVRRAGERVGARVGSAGRVGVQWHVVPVGIAVSVGDLPEVPHRTLDEAVVFGCLEVVDRRDTFAQQSLEVVQ